MGSFPDGIWVGGLLLIGVLSLGVALFDPGIAGFQQTIALFAVFVLLFGFWWSHRRLSAGWPEILLLGSGLAVLLLVLVVTEWNRPSMELLVALGMLVLLVLGRLLWSSLPELLNPSTRQTGAMGVFAGVVILVLEATVLDPVRNGRTGFLMIFFGLVMVLAPNWVDSIGRSEEH